MMKRKAAAVLTAAVCFVLAAGWLTACARGAGGPPQSGSAAETERAAETAAAETEAAETEAAETEAAETAAPETGGAGAAEAAGSETTGAAASGTAGKAEPEELPSWARLTARDERCDLDLDGTDERLILSRGAFSAFRGEKLLFTSDPAWTVAEALHTDLDDDGREEVVLLVWKRGSYGEHRPFWEKENDTELAEHLFVYACEEERLKPLWMSSSTGTNIRAVTVDRNAVFTLHGADGTDALLRWEGWGFKFIDPEGSAAGEADSGETPGSAAGEAGAGETAENTEKAAPAEVTLLCAGDNIAHSTVYETARIPGTGDFDFTPVYRHVKERISAYDIAVVNQETIFTRDPADRSSFPAFATPEAMGDALADAGFDVVLGATNHCMDRGAKGIGATLSFWKEKHPEILVLGLHDSEEERERIPVLTRNGIRIAMLNYTYGLNGNDPASADAYRVDLTEDGTRLAGQVRDAVEAADIVLVFLHIGEEYAGEPTEEQRRMAALAVDAGAAAVICSHSHVVQGAERLRTPEGNEGVVFWSLGNFMSNQTDPRTVAGAAAELVIRSGGPEAKIAEFRMIPLVSHFGNGGTEVYWLDDYTDALAAEHYLTKTGTPLTLQELREQWTEKAGVW